jgi:TM2 domain-containing membrane protein YozV
MAFCSNCGADLTGQFCAKCGTHVSGQAMAPALAAPDPQLAEVRDLNRRVRDQRHGLPALLSFFVPGLGQMVKGQFLWGIGIMFAMAVCAALCLLYIGIPLLGIVWIAQLYDAYVKPDAATAADIEAVARRSRPT